MAIKIISYLTTIATIITFANVMFRCCGCSDAEPQNVLPPSSIDNKPDRPYLELLLMTNNETRYLSALQLHLADVKYHAGAAAVTSGVLSVAASATPARPLAAREQAVRQEEENERHRLHQEEEDSLERALPVPGLIN